ncbi:MAG: dihydropteroate synthase [Planctomycetes bacterium]|nr:dihydropteroate synthase [Planctomycetota bacterium]
MPLDRPRVMGILNVTPDSFSDGGSYGDTSAAVARAMEMIAQGTDLIDVGGESTRPGAQPVEGTEQCRRVVGVITRLAEELKKAGSPAVISVDTSLVEVAEAALNAGASIINDVFAGRDPRNGDGEQMLDLAARRGAAIVLMHMKGTPQTMQQNPAYGDVTAEVESFLLSRAAAAERCGVKRSQIVLDPGIGFGKTKEHNLTLLANLSRLASHDLPVLLGCSRKRFMGSICTPPGGAPPEPTELIGATCAATAIGVMRGVKIVRVHDIAANRQAADVAWAIGAASGVRR